MENTLIKVVPKTRLYFDSKWFSCFLCCLRRSLNFSCPFLKLLGVGATCFHFPFSPIKHLTARIPFRKIFISTIRHSPFKNVFECGVKMVCFPYSYLFRSKHLLSKSFTVCVLRIKIKRRPNKYERRNTKRRPYQCDIFFSVFSYCYSV